jgi:hypothetical protein
MNADQGPRSLVDSAHPQFKSKEVEIKDKDKIVFKTLEELFN